jgi:4-hydroxybenzoyl-CoA thioesterase
LIYTKTIQIEFNHCDPAGIVFYPRYFEMTNSVIENFFADVVGAPFSTIHRTAGSGVPVVNIEAKFSSPSRLGDKVEFGLDISKLGGSSLSFEIGGTCFGELRLRTVITVVWMENWQAHGWPAAIHKRLREFSEKSA